MQQFDREEYESFDITSTAPTSAAPDGDDTEDDGQPLSLVEQDGKRQLVGYAVVWGAVSKIRRMGKRHRFAKGSIVWTTPTAALWHHDLATPLASTDNETLTIVEDDYGVKVTIDLDETTDGQNSYIRVKNRLVAGMSFGGAPISFAPTSVPDVLDVTKFIADEVSITIKPAMTETSITTAAQSDDLKKNIQQKKDSVMSSQKNTLEKLRLALMRP